MTRTNITVGEKIKRHLDKIAPYPDSVKGIAIHIHEKVSTVRKEVRRLYRKGEIDRPFWGFYRSKKTIVTKYGLAKPELKLHGIKLEYRGTKCHEFYTESYLRNKFPMSPIKQHPKNHSLIVFYTLGVNNILIPLTITVHPNLLEIWVKETTEKPLSIYESLFLAGWIIGTFGIPSNEFMVIQTGISRDIEKLYISGHTSITLAAYINALIRIYQHGKSTRFEAHMSSKHNDPKIATLEDLIGILYFGIEGRYEFTTFINKLENIESKISEMNVQISSLSKSIPMDTVKSIMEIIAEISKELGDIKSAEYDIISFDYQPIRGEIE